MLGEGEDNTSWMKIGKGLASGVEALVICCKDSPYNRMEGYARDLLDNITLMKQKALLEKVKSRLIDSYASSIIDKVEFEPKIIYLKIKLTQLD